MLKKPIAAAIVVAFACAFSAVHADDVIQAASTQDQSNEADGSAKKVKDLSAVKVSGSLINNAQIQTATPTYTITAQDIQSRGFNSVSEVLQSSVFATGSVQGPQSSGGFTQGAQTISLYGLNPEFTLILLDGKPISQFGQLYNGTSNFSNISNIPISMIDHVDVMPGGGSSIYGSNAIAGVVNIVTKEHMDGAEVVVRTGNFSDGGGANQRIALSFGKDIGKLNVLGSLEFDNASPMWAYQRSLTASTRANPNGLGTPTTVATVIDYGTLNQYTGNPLGYITPADGCKATSGLFNGTTGLASSSVASRYGQFCGSQNVLGYTTLQNQNRSYDGMLKLRYNVNDHVRLYSDMLVDWQQQKYTPGSNFNWWGPTDFPGGYIQDATTGHILYPERVFAPEEIQGGYNSQLTRQNDLMYQADIGANGQFGESNWDWDVYYLRSGDRTDLSQPERLASAVDDYFGKILGPSLGIDPDTGLAKYNPNYAAFFQPLTPAEYAGFSRNISGSSNTWINNTRATISDSSLFSLPGGDAGIAILAEGGNQAWYQPINPLIANNEIWGLTGTSGGGQRSHYASAVELNLPLFKQLTLDLSGRYDHYKTDASTNHKFTYKAGIEYRPFETLLLRGNYSTSFLAPDMASLFLGPSGYYTDVTDYYQCALAHSNNCDNYMTQVPGKNLANPKLQPTTATSWTVGGVWAPVDNASFTVDYLHIAIQNEVVQQDVIQLMRQDSQCLLGQLDPTSATCLAVLGSNGNNGQVQRDAFGNVSNITTYYVNLANEVTDSITAQAKYRFNPTPVGTFSLQLDYNNMLKHNYQIYPGTVPINQLTNPLYSSEFKSIVSGSLSWNLHDQWSSTLYWHRYGASPNYAAMVNGANYPTAGSVAPWITYNWSFSYSPIKNLDLSLLINNVLNKMPPGDKTFTSYPYYNTENYNPYGREYMLQLDYRFGGKS
jgi:outer membrane receptor protein involved in Fe transport